MKKILLWGGLAGVVALILFIGYFVAQYGHETRKLVQYNPPMTTYIYDRNGEKIANIFDKQNRAYVTFDEIPPLVIEALLAIEDTTFFEHRGVNVDAIFRAIIKDIKAGKLVEGASTITQQLVKNTLLTREKKFSRKLKELIFSLKLETELSKEEILERYLNAIYLGHGYYGIKTAAQGYFHKPLNRLTLKETAILVGLPKAPSFYAPTRNYELSLGRANRVISRMHALGWVDDESYNTALQERPGVFDETLTQNRAPYVTDEVLRRAAVLYPDIRTGGYTINTTVDLRLQEAGREALSYAYDGILERAMKRDEDANASQFGELNGALVSIEPATGEILALVGGVDYTKSAFNRATQARRQPGSAFKPFIYQVALDLGYSPATELVDIARTYDYETEGSEKKWQPKNYERDYKGLITLREALVHSRNLATINLVTDIGLSRIYRELSRYQFAGLPLDLSLALGSITLSPVELAGAYSSFAAGGVQSDPYLITSIDKRGTHYDAEPKQREVTSPAQAYLMTTILRDVVLRGTGRASAVGGIETAGKTGTTNNSIDAWFAGYSPSVETVVWFGNDDNTPLPKRETGGRAAAPAFRKFYTQLLHLFPQVPRKFVMPEGVTKVERNGAEEFFTKASPPPVEKMPSEAEDGLLF
ncbi:MULTISPECIES: PBP1A family penicillin-binding protein [Sulfurimonas]|uniref:PBP1A family penicillin-binding protein n=1 Tax=Sulfurimonas diazotrophicus TaxID=3131939 RepID=A0ABZ3HCV8_9BACT